MTGEKDRTTLKELDPLQGSLRDADDNVVDALLADYEAAAEDARYRDRFLHYTYYLSLVILSFTVSAGWAAYSEFQHQIWPVIPFGIGGVFIFSILLFWAESFRGARNASWARRTEIESYLGYIEPGVLESNTDVSNRLIHEVFEFSSRNRYEKMKVGRYLRYFLQVVIILHAAITLFGVIMLLMG